MLKLTKGDMPIGDFTTYDDLYQYLNNWKNRTHLESCSKQQHGFWPPLAIKATKMPGTGYGAPHDQETLHDQDHSVREQTQGSDQGTSQESGQGSNWETLPIPPEAALKTEGFQKQWCLAYCHAYNLTVTETDNEGAGTKSLVETSNVNGVYPGDIMGSETQGGAL